MADLLAKARAGRAIALKTRAENATTAAAADASGARITLRSKKAASLPLFVSARTRLVQAEADKAARDAAIRDIERAYFASTLQGPAPGTLLH